MDIKNIKTISFVPPSNKDTALKQSLVEKVAISRLPPVNLSYDSVKIFVEKTCSSMLKLNTGNLYNLFRLCLEQAPSEAIFGYSEQNGFSISALNKRGFSFSSSFWVKIKPEKVELYSGLKDKVELGRGTYKTVIGGMQATVPKQSDRSKLLEISSGSCALSQIAYGESRSVSQGIQMHKEILKIPGTDPYFVALPCLEVRSRETLEMLVDPYYHGSLEKAVSNRSIPQEMGSLKRISLSTTDFIRFSKNLTEGVRLLGENQVFHKDIKLDNIRMKVGKDGVVNALIGDFDLTSKESLSWSQSDYLYWNKACSIGYASAETDRFGLVLAIARMLLCEGEAISNEASFYERISLNSESERACLWQKYQGSMKKDSFDKVFDLLKKTLESDDQVGNSLQVQIAEVEKSSQLPANSIKRYRAPALSREEINVYTALLQERAPKALQEYPIPSIAEINDVLNHLEIR